LVSFSRKPALLAYHHREVAIQETSGGTERNVVAFKVGRLHLEKTKLSGKYHVEALKLG
jgi:hypothetical protein